MRVILSPLVKVGDFLWLGHASRATFSSRRFFSASGKSHRQRSRKTARLGVGGMPRQKSRIHPTARLGAAPIEPWSADRLMRHKRSYLAFGPLRPSVPIRGVSRPGHHKVGELGFRGSGFLSRVRSDVIHVISPSVRCGRRCDCLRVHARARARGGGGRGAPK